MCDVTFPLKIGKRGIRVVDLNWATTGYKKNTYEKSKKYLHIVNGGRFSGAATDCFIQLRYSSFEKLSVVVERTAVACNKQNIFDAHEKKGGIEIEEKQISQSKHILFFMFLAISGLSSLYRAAVSRTDSLMDS